MELRQAVVRQLAVQQLVVPVQALPYVVAVQVVVRHAVVHAAATTRQRYSATSGKAVTIRQRPLTSTWARGLASSRW